MIIRETSGHDLQIKYKACWVKSLKRNVPFYIRNVGYNTPEENVVSGHWLDDIDSTVNSTTKELQLCAGKPDPGYFNTNTSCYFLQYSATRQYSLGLNSKIASYLNIYGKIISPRIDKSSARELMTYCFYPHAFISFNDAVKQVSSLQKTAVAIDRQFAVAGVNYMSLPVLFYKTKPIGHIEENTVFIPKQLEFFAKSIKNYINLAEDIVCYG